MSWLNVLSNSKPTDSFLVIIRVLHRFNIRFTDKEVERQLGAHPEYQSFLAVKDVLSSYGVESAAIRKGAYTYSDFEAPFICSIQHADWPNPMFIVVLHAENDSIRFIDPVLSKERSVSLANFQQMDKEIVLLLDGDNPIDEPNYKENRKAQTRDKILGNLPMAFSLFPLIWVGLFLFLGNSVFLQNWISLAFLLNSFVGLGVCTLLLWHEVDAHNPFLKEVCGGNGGRANCGAVLGSKGSFFLGISWSAWGFSYFSAQFISQLFFPGQIAQLTFWSITSLFAASYIAYSIYYQARVIKQWCPLCVTVQAVLLLNAIVSVLYTIYREFLIWNWYDTGMIILTGICFLFLSSRAIPLLKQAKNSKDFERKWKRLKYNPDIFRSLLEKADPVLTSAEGVGIVIGNPEAQREIIKVCNPYCGPCSKAHPKLDEIIRNNPELRLRIIFTASGEDSDIRTHPVLHLLAIQEEYGLKTVHQAMDDWYMPEQKDYALFAKKYPMKEELQRQQDKIHAMRQWCDTMKIRATPTIYIDGYELPDSYMIDELKNLL